MGSAHVQHVTRMRTTPRELRDMADLMEKKLETAKCGDDLTVQIFTSDCGDEVRIVADPACSLPQQPTSNAAASRHNGVPGSSAKVPPIPEVVSGEGPFRNHELQEMRKSCNAADMVIFGDNMGEVKTLSANRVNLALDILNKVPRTADGVVCFPGLVVYIVDGYNAVTKAIISGVSLEAQGVSVRGQPFNHEGTVRPGSCWVNHSLAMAAAGPSVNRP